MLPGFLGVTELILGGVVAALLFGPKRVPRIARLVGRGIRDVKQTAEDAQLKKEELQIPRDSP